ncbi:MAG TPA: T3SS effector HopA1 family protein [Nostocaceae cyanobacterium]|nr:T3SS effector HopA1 family protein [Nostocaceae cyanobacterium]
MQLLNSSHVQLSQLPKQLQTSLQNIVNQVEIESYYRIKHPQYQPVELPETVTNRFQNLPAEMQAKHLTLQLRNFLYSVYYNGSLVTNDNQENQTRDLVNNSIFGVDLTFYNRLHQSNQSVGYWNFDWLVVQTEANGTLAVQKNGLTLYVEPELYQAPADQTVTIGKTVAIKMPKNLVQNGFYMAISNQNPPGNQDITRIYFNLSPEGAVAVMQSLTSGLNALKIPFSFKALYNPTDYRRYDSAVLYFNKHNYSLVLPVLTRIYQEHQSYFSDQVPLFTKQLAPGLACAEEPQHKFGEKESFGTNRCQIIANGLINAWEKNEQTPEGKMQFIFNQFALEEINLQCPYLNANSEDIYTPLSA